MTREQTVCVVVGCDAQATTVVEAPDGRLRLVCRRCAEELIALFGHVHAKT